MVLAASVLGAPAKASATIKRMMAHLLSFFMIYYLQTKCPFVHKCDAQLENFLMLKPFFSMRE
jgi:hypothetical protein